MDIQERAENFSIQAQKAKFPRSPRMRILEISRFDIKKPKVEGLDQLPKTPCVVATTHLADIDVPEVAQALAGSRKIGIASQETNLTNPLFAPFVKAVGRDNFFPVTNSITNGHVGYSLRMEDLDKMVEGIEVDGRTMIIAGHSPTRNWQLPNHPGIAAVILAHKAKVPLVPAAVDIESKTPVAQSTDPLTRFKNFVTNNRPGAKIIFGKPMNLEEIPEDKLEAAIGLYSPDKRRAMSEDQLSEAQETLRILQAESEEMMRALAEKLPPEKRGKWGQNE